VADEAALAPEDFLTFAWRDLEFSFPKDRGQWDMNVQFEMEEGRRNRGTLMLIANSADPEDMQAAKAKVYSVARTAKDWDDFTSDLAEFLNKNATG